jgi:rubrerythrin
MDRVEGQDANNMLQCYTDILPGRPTVVEHRHPADDLREHYDRATAAPISKINSIIIVAAENQVRDYYMNIGPIFSDPVARQLYAEIASIEEQHTTQYECMQDPNETMLEKWLIHELSEVYAYYSCARQEQNPRLKALWERFVDYELGHFHEVAALMKRIENRDPAELVPETLPTPIDFSSQRKYVREILSTQVPLRTNGTQFVPLEQESELSIAYRERMNRAGSPSERVAAGYRWMPGTELNKYTGDGARVQEARP